MGRRSAKRFREMPLVWFGVYADCVQERAPALTGETPPMLDWRPALTPDMYRQRLKAIRDYIQAGDTYQVNFTFPLTAVFEGDPEAWFYQLHAAQPTDYAAYLDMGRYKLLSLSPELFFEVDGRQITTRPMKGTMPRGPSVEEDGRARERLRQSVKDQAENLMIVDLLRNDLGRVSDTGAVRVDRLFEVERYATIWQMTSTIRAQSSAPLSSLVRALFPCGSVTGAPKIRTMEIIDEVEEQPRGVYCGALGWWGPDRQARFNVAIRTITLDVETHLAHYPVGGGVTWDSNAEGEYAECLAKAAVLSRQQAPFELLETLLYEDDGYFLLPAHLDRLCASADYFDVPLSRKTVEALLHQTARELAPGKWKVRLLANRRGQCRTETAPAPTPREMRIALAKSPVCRDCVFLHHKTTRREVYERALAEQPGYDDVLLWNEQGELTETTMANIVVAQGGELVTPPLSCGLLPGVMRRELLRQGVIREATLHRDDLAAGASFWLINSVRKKNPRATARGRLTMRQQGSQFEGADPRQMVCRYSWGRSDVRQNV